MRKLYVLLGTLLACVVVGCGDDPNDKVIAETISTLRNTTSDIEHVSKTINDAVNQAKNSKKPLDIAEIDKATKEAAGLKKKAQDLQNEKAWMDVRKDNITAEQREEYANRYKVDIGKALQGLDAAQKNLELALREADSVADSDGKSSLQKLRETLQEAQNEFEVLTKRQS